MSRNINIGGFNGGGGGGGGGAGPPPIPYPMSSSMPPNADYLNAQFAMQQQQQQQQQQRQRMQSPPQAMLSSSFPSNSFPAGMIQRPPPPPPQLPQQPLPTPQQIGLAIMSSIEDHLQHQQQQQFAHSQSMQFPGQQFPHQQPPPPPPPPPMQPSVPYPYPGQQHFPHQFPPRPPLPPQHQQHQHHQHQQFQRPPSHRNFPQQQPPPLPPQQFVAAPMNKDLALAAREAAMLDTRATWSTGDDRQQQQHQKQPVAMATKPQQPQPQPVRRQRLNSLHRSSSDPEFFTGRRRHFVPVQRKQQQQHPPAHQPPPNRQAAIEAGLARLRLNSCKAEELQSAMKPTGPEATTSKEQPQSKPTVEERVEEVDETEERDVGAQARAVDEVGVGDGAGHDDGDEDAPDAAGVHGLEDPVPAPPDTDATLHQACSALLTYRRSTGGGDDSDFDESPTVTAKGDEEEEEREKDKATISAEDAAKHAQLDQLVSKEALAEKLSGGGSTEEQPVPLQTTWILYLSRNNEWTSNEDYLAKLQRLNTIKSVQSFWATLRYVPTVDMLPTKACYHFMREDRLPIWETDYHIEGGSFRFKCPKLHTETIWQELLLAAIGEHLSDWLAKGDEISGVSCSVRESQDIVEIWHTRADLTSRASIFEQVPRLLPKNTKFLASFHKAFRDNYFTQKEQRRQLAADNKASSSPPPPPGLGGGQQRGKRGSASAEAGRGAGRSQRKSIGH